MPANPKIKVENLYDVALTAPVASATGNVTLSLTSAPANPFGGLVIDPDDSGKRETVIYHAKSGLDVSVYGVNRTNGNTHLAGAPVRMLNVAELFNLMSGMVSWTFFTFQRSALDITVNGGPVAPGLTAPDADITVGNGTTYLWYKPSDNSINSTQNSAVITAGNGIRFATVVAGGGSISSITYDRYITGPALFSSMMDVAVTGATDGQIVSWNATNEKWEPAVREFNLNELLDVEAPAPSDGQVIAWSAADNKWKPITQQASTSTPAPSGAVTTDEGTYWKTTYADGSFTEYRTDGIHYYDSNSIKYAYTALTGTYSTSGMSYTNGTVVGEDGEISGGGNVAMLDRQNIFTQYNQFESGALFKKTVYGELLVNAGNTIDWSLGNSQKRSTLSSAAAFTFTNMYPGNQFCLFIDAASGASISSITCTAVGGGALTSKYIGGTVPNITVPGGYVIAMYVGETAVHIFANGPTV
jgi:hypothetical protein